MSWVVWVHVVNVITNLLVIACFVHEWTRRRPIQVPPQSGPYRSSGKVHSA